MIITLFPWGFRLRFGQVVCSFLWADKHYLHGYKLIHAHYKRTEVSPFNTIKALEAVEVLEKARKQ